MRSKAMRINPSTQASVLTPMTLVPLGAVLASAVGLFAIARHVSTIEVKTESNVESVAEIRAYQRSNFREIEKDLSEMKSMQAATNAKISMLIDHFGIEPKNRR